MGRQGIHSVDGGLVAFELLFRQMPVDVLRGEGDVGMELRAVVGHERANPAVVGANGFAPFAVSRVYLETLRESLRTAASLQARAVVVGWVRVVTSRQT